MGTFLGDLGMMIAYIYMLNTSKHWYSLQRNLGMIEPTNICDFHQQSGFIGKNGEFVNKMNLVGLELFGAFKHIGVPPTGCLSVPARWMKIMVYSLRDGRGFGKTLQKAHGYSIGPFQSHNLSISRNLQTKMPNNIGLMMVMENVVPLKPLVDYQLSLVLLKFAIGWIPHFQTHQNITYIGYIQIHSPITSL